MGQTNIPRRKADVQKGILTFIGVVLVVVLFAVSVFCAVFSGGEIPLIPEEEEIKGLLQINSANYKTMYFEGDSFSFDKDTADISLVAKDPDYEELVKVEHLPTSEFGFRINGEENFISNPESITMSKDIETIELISREYPSLSVPLEYSIASAPDASKLRNELTLEAETADLYREDVILSTADKTVEPDEATPFISSSGNPNSNINPDILSGGACLRNFQSLNMRVEFQVVCQRETQVELTVIACSRTSNKEAEDTFSDHFKFTVNGESIAAIDNYNMPLASNYFTPHEITVTITLPRGINMLVFESGSDLGTKSPYNLDAVRVAALNGRAVLGTLDSIGEKTATQIADEAEKQENAGGNESSAAA